MENNVDNTNVEKNEGFHVSKKVWRKENCTPIIVIHKVIDHHLCLYTLNFRERT